MKRVPIQNAPQFSSETLALYKSLTYILTHANDIITTRKDTYTSIDNF